MKPKPINASANVLVLSCRCFDSLAVQPAQMVTKLTLGLA